MEFALRAEPRPSLAIKDSPKRFPVRRVYCVGMNYAAHAREMGNDPDRDPPLFFMKAPDTVVDAANPVDLAYPPATQNLHHEVELLVAIGKEAFALTPETATQCVYGYGVGIDFTRRDLQAAAKRMGRPWDAAKTFDGAGPCSAITPGTEPPHRPIWLSVNGKNRQLSNTEKMTWSVPELLVHLSALFVLRAGDLIFTGTPDGVGPVAVGDKIDAGIDGLGTLSVTII